MSKWWKTINDTVQAAFFRLNETDWVTIQNSLRCCGYNGKNRTATTCENDTKDCYLYLEEQSYLFIYCSFGVCIVLFIFLLVIDISNCHKIKSNRLSYWIVCNKQINNSCRILLDDVEAYWQLLL